MSCAITFREKWDPPGHGLFCLEKGKKGDNDEQKNSFIRDKIKDTFDKRESKACMDGFWLCRASNSPFGGVYLLSYCRGYPYQFY